MSATITLRVITPERVLLDTTADQVRFPGLDGSMGVLRNHAPMVAALDAGELRWEGSEGRGRMFVAGGFAEVRGNTLRLVTEAGEPASAIDVARADRAADRARERLRNPQAAGIPRDDFDRLRAQAALHRALMRKLVAGRE